MSINQAARLVENIGGLFIPAHVDRKGFGLIPNLGFVPADCWCDALEFSKHFEPAAMTSKFPQVKGYPLIQNGDVHGLDEFVGATEFYLNAPTVPELKMALKGEGGRKYWGS